MMKNILIRPARPEDCPAMIALWLHTEGMGLRKLDDSPAGITRFLERNPGCSFVALAGADLAGVILCGHDGRRGYIYHAAVAKAYRRRGVASALVQAAQEALRREGITRITLDAFRDNAAGAAFWERQGWERKDLLAVFSKGITALDNDYLK